MGLGKTSHEIRNHGEVRWRENNKKIIKGPKPTKIQKQHKIKKLLCSARTRRRREVHDDVDVYV